MKKFNVGIVGAAGYTGGELFRLLLNHENVGNISAVSRSHAGTMVTQAHPDLHGETKVKFTSALNGNEDVIFLCMGHGESAKWIDLNSITEKQIVIDLSQDFRLKRNSWAYGLSEWNKESIKTSRLIANPGCFATLIQLMLAPIAQAGLLSGNIEIAATTGSTGAGQQPNAQTHFSWRNGNHSAYKPLAHQHLDEIHETISQLQISWKDKINLIPFRGSFTRGIHAVAHLEMNTSIEEFSSAFYNSYNNEPFVHMVEHAPDVKQLVNTNKCFLHLEEINNRLVITGAIDNLLKGASGQAVQNMNIALGITETTGLKLKPLAY